MSLLRSPLDKRPPENTVKRETTRGVHVNAVVSVKDGMCVCVCVCVCMALRVCGDEGHSSAIETLHCETRKSCGIVGLSHLGSVFERPSQLTSKWDDGNGHLHAITHAQEHSCKAECDRNGCCIATDAHGFGRSNGLCVGLCVHHHHCCTAILLSDSASVQHHSK